MMVVACAASVSTYAQTCLGDNLAFRVKDQAFNHSQVEELSEFMTDELGSRLAASQMKLRAEGLVIDKLKEMGLSNPRAEFAYEFE